MNSDIDVKDNDDVIHKEKEKYDYIVLSSDNVKEINVGLIDDIINDNTTFEDANNEIKEDEHFDNIFEPIDNIPNGQVKVIVPTSGKPYYFNKRSRLVDLIQCIFTNTYSSLLKVVKVGDLELLENGTIMDDDADLNTLSNANSHDDVDLNENNNEKQHEAMDYQMLVLYTFVVFI